MNATKHGERSAQRRAEWRELNATLRALRAYDRRQTGSLDGVGQASVWLDRIAGELDQ